MKKIYQNPELKIVAIQPMKMLQESKYSFSINSENKYDGTSEIQARRRGFSWNNDAGSGDDDSSEDNAW